MFITFIAFAKWDTLRVKRILFQCGYSLKHARFSQRQKCHVYYARGMLKLFPLTVNEPSLRKHARVRRKCRKCTTVERDSGKFSFVCNHESETLNILDECARLF